MSTHQRLINAHNSAQQRRKGRNMKQTLMILTLALTACVACAEPRGAMCDIALSTISATATNGTNTIDGVNGWLEEVQILCTDDAAAATVTVSAVPTDSTVAAYTLATASVTADKTFRPRVDGTDTAGSALTSDPPGRFFLLGDQIRFVVTGSDTTNVTWRCRVKYDNGRR